MTKKTFAIALRKLGYRQPDQSINPNRWVKPFGFCVIIADVDHLRIQSLFRGPNDGKLHCWNHVDIDLVTPIEHQIASFEQYEGCRAGHDYTDFGFLTKEELIFSTIESY